MCPGTGLGWAACRRAGMGSHILGMLALQGQSRWVMRPHTVGTFR